MIVRRVVLCLMACCYAAVTGATLPDPTPAGDWISLREVLEDTSLAADWRDQRGYSIVYYHLVYGSEDRALELLKKMPVAKQRMEGNSRLLTVAIREQSQRMVKRLLQLGESPNVQYAGEESPLMVATELGLLEIMRMLLRAGADPNYAIDGETAVHRALEKANYYSFRLLLDSGFDLKRQSEINSDKSLIFAAMRGDDRASLRHLAWKGFNLDTPRLDGQSPLQLAADELREAMIDVLLEAGANACQRDDKGRLPKEIYQQRLRQRHPSALPGDAGAFARTKCN